MRFWLASTGPHLSELDRMRSDMTLDFVARARYRAHPPGSTGTFLPAQGIAAAPAVGGHWTRSNEVEIDIVGADRHPVARQLLFPGSVKWPETAPFDDRNLVELQRHRDQVTSEPVPLIALSHSGTVTNRVDATFSPEDLLEAWSAPGPGRGGPQPPASENSAFIAMSIMYASCDSPLGHK